jgi:hypothetical protein
MSTDVIDGVEMMAVQNMNNAGLIFTPGSKDLETEWSPIHA